MKTGKTNEKYYKGEIPSKSTNSKWKYHILY